MAASPTRIIANNPDNTGASRNGRSLVEVAATSVPLERLDDRLVVGDCPFRGCEDPVGSFRIFKNPDSVETFECGSCQRAGDLRDFEELMVSLDGAELLSRLVAFIRRFVALSYVQAVMVALWVMHTHAIDAADCTPYLDIKSAEKRSGKTRLLEVLALLVARPWLTGRVSAAVLVRKTANEQPSLLLDESDAAFKGDKEYAEALRGILNAGFRRGGVTSLCVGQGANLSYRDFPVFSPKAIAGIGKLPDTIADRAVPIELRRRRRGEHVERFRQRKVVPDAVPLHSAVAAWAEANLTALADAEPELPDELDDRAQDIVEPLLAIAEAVGGEWPDRARHAAAALLTGEHRDDAESLGVRLLRDTRSTFDAEGADKLTTGRLLDQLLKHDDAPWRYLNGGPLDANRLARMLKPYGIAPKQFKESGGKARGYLRAHFEDAWARYLPEPGTEPGTPIPSQENPLVERDSAVPGSPGLADVETDPVPRTPHEQARVPRVPPNEGGTRNTGAHGHDDPYTSAYINEQGEAEF
jgi:hypothetical protein